MASEIHTDTSVILWILGQTMAILGSGGYVLYRFGKAVATFEKIGEQQAEELNEVKTEIKALSKVVTELALQNQRQDMIEARVERTERLLEDMRRGEGFILPLASHLEEK